MQKENAFQLNCILGKLLATPSKLFKLVVPLSTRPWEPRRKGTLTRGVNTRNDRGKGMLTSSLELEPLILLIHPQQPLSYLERLIQAEVPLIMGDKGEWKIPAVSFISHQLDEDAIRPKTTAQGAGNAIVDRVEDVRDVNKKDGDGGHLAEGQSPRETGHGRSNGYVPLAKWNEHLDSDNDQFVRWSLSTEIGDFMRDASRGREFLISIEGAPAGLGHIRIMVPSFNQRTYFLRMRLRKISQQLESTAELKHECDVLAQRGAQRVAIAGLFVLASWWCCVYILTFQTNLGWDTMEPVTYLVSMSSLMGGYLWFLYHNREISYKSALDFTISARQHKLYQAKGVDLQLWETLLDECRTLRKEIKGIAAEYDVDWDERIDEQGEQVTQALRKEKQPKDGDDKKSDSSKEDAEDDGA